MNLMRHAAAIFLTIGMAIGLGWVAFQLQQQSTLPAFFFPLIFPLLVGGLVGVGSVTLLRGLVTPSRIMVFLMALLAGVAVVAAQGWFSYRAYAAEIEGQIGRNPMATVARSATEDFTYAPLHRFIAAQIDRSGGWWLINAALTIAASAIVTWFVSPQRRTTQLSP